MPNECVRFDLESCKLNVYIYIPPLAQARPMMLCIYISIPVSARSGSPPQCSTFSSMSMKVPSARRGPHSCQRRISRVQPDLRKLCCWLKNARLCKRPTSVQNLLIECLPDYVEARTGSHGALWCSFASPAGSDRLLGCSDCRCTDSQYHICSYAAEGVPRHSRTLQGTH